MSKKQSPITIKSKLKPFIELSKPGIMRSNLIVALACYIYASEGVYDWYKLAFFILASSLIIASAATINNIFDKSIDAKMSRTKKRVLAQQTLGLNNAIIYSIITGLLGVLIATISVNSLTALVGFITLIFYAFVYTFLKKKTEYSTIIGTFPGAAPTLAGYAAASGSIDYKAGFLFGILFFWQIVHFYAIAIFRHGDYKKAHLPTMISRYGLANTKTQMLVSFGLYILLTNIFIFEGFTTAWPWLAINLLINSYWSIKIINYQLDLKNRKLSKSSDIWARQVFISSIAVLGLFSLLIIIASFFE